MSPTVDTINARNSKNVDAKYLKTAAKVTGVQRDVGQDGKGKLHKLKPDRNSKNFNAKCRKNGVKVTGVQMDVVRDRKGKLHKLSH